MNPNNRMHKNNSTGINGLSYCKKIKLYRVQMMVDGKYIYRKRFKDFNEAKLVAEFNNEIRYL
jgi:hypothetical protein